MGRSMVQLDQQVKLDLEAWKRKYRHDNVSLSDCVEALLFYHARAESDKIVAKEQAEKKHKERLQTMIYLGADLKKRYMEIVEDLALGSEAAGVDFLLRLFAQSNSIPKSLFINHAQNCRERLSGKR